MSVMMVPFIIPPEIQEGLFNGTYEQIGGVIRNVGNKQVVKWLKEASIEQKTSELSVKAVQMVKDNKVVVGLAATLGLAIAGGAIYLGSKSKKEKTKLNVKFEQFHQSFTEYLEETQEKTLSKNRIEKIENDLSEINQLFSNSDMKFDREVQEQWTTIIELILDFTKRFADKNSYPIAVSDFKDEGIKNNLIKLEDYLKIQKDVFTDLDNNLEVNA